MSTVVVHVDVLVTYDGDEMQALADVNELVEAMPSDYEGPVTSLFAQGWSTP